MAAKKTTPSRVRLFLDNYAQSGNVAASAAAAGIDRKMHYRKLKGDSEYRKEFESLEDQAGQLLEDIAMDRCVNGVKRQLYWRGKPIKTRNGHLVYEVDYDNQLLITMLKRFRPKFYREHVVQEHTGSINLVERLEAARARLIAMKKEEDEKDKAG